VGYLQDAADLLGPAVEESLRALSLAPSDEGAKQLARAYARQIDDAARAEVLAERALDEIPADDVMARAYVQALAAKVEAKELVEKLGPKLLAVLESLGATPAARGRMKGGASNAAPSQLERLRQARGSRPAS